MTTIYQPNWCKILIVCLLSGLGSSTSSHWYAGSQRRLVGLMGVLGVAVTWMFWIELRWVPLNAPEFIRTSLHYESWLVDKIDNWYLSFCLHVLLRCYASLRDGKTQYISWLFGWLALLCFSATSPLDKFGAELLSKMQTFHIIGHLFTTGSSVPRILKYLATDNLLCTERTAGVMPNLRTFNTSLDVFHCQANWSWTVASCFWLLCWSVFL